MLGGGLLDHDHPKVESCRAFSFRAVCEDKPFFCQHTRHVLLVIKKRDHHLPEPNGQHGKDDVKKSDS